MPEDIKPPKTALEQGVYIAWIFSDMKEVKNTLKEIKDGSVSRIEFDEHVAWGQAVVKDHDDRLKTLENKALIEKSSIWEKIKNGISDRFVSIIVIVIIAAALFFIVKFSQPETLQIIK